MFNQWDMSLMQEVIDQVFHTDLVPGEAVALTQNCWFSERKMVEKGTYKERDLWAEEQKTDLCNLCSCCR